MEKFIVYGRNDCHFCESAVNLLFQMGKDFEFVSDAKLIKEKQKTYSHRTVPIIMEFSMGVLTYIGGFDNLKEKFDDSAYREKKSDFDT